MYLNVALIVGFILFYAAIAGRVERSAVSGAMLFTAFGLICGPSVLGILDFHAGDKTIRLLAELTLAIILFVDAAHADLGVIKKNVQMLIRLLGVSLPLSIAAGTVAAKFIFAEFTWVESALLATVLAPTDAALGKPVVNNKSVPEDIREGLSFESGLNDGICVPVLLFFLAVATSPKGETLSADLLIDLFVKEIGIGALLGLAIVGISSAMIKSTQERGWITDLWSRLLVPAMAVTCFASAQWFGGSGLIASFVGGMLFGTLAKRRKKELLTSGEVFGETFTVLAWIIFGVAVVGFGVTDIGWREVAYAAVSLTIVRMVPVIISLSGITISATSKMFIGWFGPRGLASVVFGLMVINHNLPGGGSIAKVVALTVTLSVLAHGLTANPLSASLARQLNKRGQNAM